MGSGRSFIRLAVIAAVAFTTSKFSVAGSIAAIPDAQDPYTDVQCASLIIDDSAVIFSGLDAVSGTYHIYNSDNSYDLVINFDSAADSATGTLNVTGVTHHTPDPAVNEIYYSANLVHFDLALLNTSLEAGSAEGYEERDFKVSFLADTGSTFAPGTLLVTEAVGSTSQVDTWVSPAVAVPAPASFAGGGVLLCTLATLKVARRRRV